MRKGNCAYCTGSFEGLNYVYRYKSTPLEFCTVNCLEDYTKYQHDHKRSRWLLAAAGILALFIWTFATTPKARAHDPQTHETDELSDAKSEAYGKCCVGDDYHKLRIEQWETTATGWRINWHGQWLDVPRHAKVKNVANPDADAKAWVFGEPDTTYVRCFMPGALT